MTLIKRLIIMIVMSGIPALLQGQPTLTVKDAIKTALEKNYAIKVARNEQEITENNFTRGNAGFLPVLTADFIRNYGIQSYDQVRQSGEISENGVKNSRQNYGVTLNWTIFDGLKMFTNYDQLQEFTKQSEENLRAEIELLVYNITSAFYTAALEKERLKLFTSNVGLSEERLQVANDKYELGRASKMEYLQAQVDLNADKSSLIQQRELLAVRKFELMRLMALKSDSLNFSLEYELKNDTTLLLTPLLDHLADQNPRLLALKRDQAIALYNQKIREGDRLPQVDLFADYSHSTFNSPAGFALSGKSDDLTYGLSASWTLFNGFNVNRQIQNAKIRYETSKYQYEDQLLEFETTLKTTFINYRNNLELKALEGENLDVARENNDIAQERYQIGLSNSVELRESQINLINAQIRYQNASFASKQAEIQLVYLSGMLIDR